MLYQPEYAVEGPTSDARAPRSERLKYEIPLSWQPRFVRHPWASGA